MSIGKTALVVGGVTVLWLALTYVLFARAPMAQTHGCGKPSESPASSNGPNATETSRQSWEDYVALTPEQRERVARIEKERNEAWEALSKKLEKAQAELDQLMQESSPRLGSVRTLVKKMAECQADMQMAKFEGIIKIRQVLTKEQRERLNKWLAEGSGGCCGKE